MMQEGQRANNAAIAILIASEPPRGTPIVPFYRPRSRRTIQRNEKRGSSRGHEKERKESEGGREREKVGEGR